jgi:hypothetical protein
MMLTISPLYFAIQNSALLVVSQCNFLNLTPAKRYPAAAGGIEMRVVSPKDDQELVRRLLTGLVACWEAIPEGVRADIL